VGQLCAQWRRKKERRSDPRNIEVRGRARTVKKIAGHVSFHATAETDSPSKCLIPVHPVYWYSPDRYQDAEQNIGTYC